MRSKRRSGRRKEEEEIQKLKRLWRRKNEKKGENEECGDRKQRRRMQ